jgi:DNA-binding winged helix-turn-helix (wHTH) protein
MAYLERFTLPEKEVKRLMEPVFQFLGRGSSVTLVGVPGTGKTGVIKYVLEHPTVAKKLLPTYPQDHLLVYLDPAEALDKTPKAFYSYLVTELLTATLPLAKLGRELKEAYEHHPPSDRDGATLFHMAKDMVSIIVQSHDINLTLIIDDFELLSQFPAAIFSSLTSLRRINNQRITFLLLGSKIPQTEDALEKFGDFSKVVFNKIIPLPLYSQTATEATIKQWGKSFGGHLSSTQIQTIIKVCGGHGACLKSATRLACLKEKVEPQKLEEMLLADTDLFLRIEAIWRFFSNTQKDALQKALASERLTPKEEKDLDLVFGCGLLIRKEDGIQPFGKVFSAFLASKPGGFPHLAYDQKTGEVLVNGTSATDKLTAQEYNLLNFLVAHQNRVCTRDEIAEALWGGKYHEKYSDWAIDRLTSRLRQKLNLSHKNPYLVTIRGRGYKFILPEL